MEPMTDVGWVRAATARGRRSRRTVVVASTRPTVVALRALDGGRTSGRERSTLADLLGVYAHSCEPPSLPPGLVRRRAAERLYQHTPPPFGLVVAPAGSGKTTFLLQAARAAHR